MLQLFDPASSTFSYILWDESTHDALLIDGVASQIERDVAHLARLGLSLTWVVETHVHADHVTSAAALRERTGARIAVPAGCGCAGADVKLEHGAMLRFGTYESIAVLATPGHTAGSASYRWRDAVFTGDALFVGGCGRTDFQDGDAGTLYDSVTQQLFTLPDATLVFPAHDYNGQCASTIGHERRHNPRFAGKSRAEFIALMNGLDLPRPKLLDVAVPANRRLGQP